MDEIRQGQQIVIVGGGAAGFFAAITCAAACPGAEVKLLEASRQPLSKVRISGGGRCNVTHACFDPAQLIQHYPRGGKALRGAFSRFQPQDTIDWFRQHGVMLKTEADGRMFPVTNDSGTIVDCLLQTARQAGVQLYTSLSLTAVQPTATGFHLTLKNGDQWIADRLLLATGSSPSGYALAQSLGHQIEPPVPSLFTLRIADAALQSLAGVAVESVQARLRFLDHKPLEQTGALLITHWGVSGPAILKLSAWGARLLHDCQYRATLEINWLPQFSQAQSHQRLLEMKQTYPNRSIATQGWAELPRRLWQYLTARSQISAEQRWAELSKVQMQQLLQQLHQGRYPIQGKGQFKEEFVTCGGVNLKQVDFKTMGSRVCPHLYLAGEVLDIDGVTGGFNFQSAWTTGWIAGQAIAQSCAASRDLSHGS
ncbi:MAG: NAD(P)/FAD-dependent oxidoreductase [Elainella sp. Prado103]|jgi:hypothetical protein|nr:NAD(P)/FAD-dependent oxidoreductase [Elainella sp. Prado103]